MQSVQDWLQTKNNPQPLNTGSGIQSVADWQATRTTTSKPAGPDNNPFSLIVAGAKGLVSGWQNTPVQPKTFDVVKGVGNYNALTAAHDAFTQGVDKVGTDLASSFDTSKPFGGRLVDAGKAIVDTIGTTFGTLLSPFQAYATVPVLGNVVDVVNKTFGAIGEGGGAAGVKEVNIAKQNGLISQDTADKITPLVHDTAALIAQIIAGKAFDVGYDKGKEVLNKITDNSKQITTEFANDPAVKDAMQKHLDSLKTNPVDNTATVSPLQSVEEWKQAGKPEVPVTIAPKVEATTTPIKETPIINSSETQPINSTEAPNTRAQTLMQAEVERKMVADQQDAPTHDVRNMAEVAKNATDYVLKNPEDTIKVLNGEIQPGGSIIPQDVYTAAEIKYMETGDQGLRQALINSEIPTKSGQALKALDSTNENSPIKIERDIRNAKEAVIEKKTGRKINKVKEDVVNEIKKSMKKVVIKKETWSSFIESIKCNY